MEQKK